MNKKGVTLLELLICIVISSVLVAGIYRTFISQQHTYTVQEQVADMQQNVRIAVNRMMREIRMAGYGSVNNLFRSPNNGWHANGDQTIYQHIITPGSKSDEVTVIAGYEPVTTLKSIDSTNPKIIYLDSASAFGEDSSNKGKQYICLNGLETQRITTITSTLSPSPGGVKVELAAPLVDVHKTGEPVYRVVAITYSLGTSNGKQGLYRNTNIEGEAAQIVAENIDGLQFRYVMKDKSVRDGSELHANQLSSDPLSYVNIRAIQVNVVAKTNMQDPQMKSGDGYRRRQVTSNIQLRNLIFQ